METRELIQEYLSRALNTIPEKHKDNKRIFTVPEQTPATLFPDSHGRKITGIGLAPSLHPYTITADYSRGFELFIYDYEPDMRTSGAYKLTLTVISEKPSWRGRIKQSIKNLVQQPEFVLDHGELKIQRILDKEKYCNDRLVELIASKYLNIWTSPDGFSVYTQKKQLR